MNQPNLPLPYKSIVALNRDTHAKLKLTERWGWAFADKMGAVPITVGEIPLCAAHYPIAFAGEPLTPVAILGLRAEANLFVNAQGEWETAAYIPAYLRRYPFMMAQSQDKSTSTLCVDLESGLFVENEGRPLFADGKPTPLLDGVLTFSRDFQAQAMATESFMETLKECGLKLQVKNREIGLPGGGKILLPNVAIVDEDVIAAIPDAGFLKLRQVGALPMIYGALLSTQRWAELAARANHRAAAKAA